MGFKKLTCLLRYYYFIKNWSKPDVSRISLTSSLTPVMTKLLLSSNALYIIKKARNRDKNGETDDLEEEEG